MNLLRYNKDQKYLVFDGESESLNLVHNKAWQLSYLICQGDKILEEYDKFPWWSDLNISDDAKRITRFNHEIYKAKATDARKVYEDFSAFLYDPEYIIIGHNILGFDIYLMNSYRKFLNLAPDWSYIPRCLDTLALSKFVKFTNPPQINDESLILSEYKLMNTWEKGVKTSLGKMAEHFDVEFDSNLAHDGLYDIKKNWEIFHKLKWQIEI